MHITAKKSLGQNFLQNPYIAAAIVDAGTVATGDTVIEVGPGKGILTRELLRAGAHVVAIEKDRRLIPHLEEMFQQEITDKKLRLIEGDALTESFTKLTKGSYKLVANIPYYITGELFRKMVAEKRLPEAAALMVQKEVAERIVAREGKESILSIAIKTFATPRIARIVPRGAFHPVPNVDSAVLSLRNFHDPFKTPTQEKNFFTVLKAGFQHKRKLLVNNLEAATSARRVAVAFAKAGLPQNSRAENLSVDNWTELAKSL